MAQERALKSEEQTATMNPELSVLLLHLSQASESYLEMIAITNCQNYYELRKSKNDRGLSIKPWTVEIAKTGVPTERCLPKQR